MFHGVRGEMDDEEKKEQKDKKDEKKKAGAVDKIKIKLKLAKQEDFAEESEEEIDYETL